MTHGKSVTGQFSPCSGFILIRNVYTGRQYTYLPLTVSGPIKQVYFLMHSAALTMELCRLTTARSICTTDTFPKLLSMTFTLPSASNITYSIAGMTKGNLST